jgi:penicillin-binding protein 2
MYGDHLKSFGLGDFMGYDLPTGKEEIYDSKTYKMYKIRTEDGGSTTISNSIGQGEVLMTQFN